ncbi:hypothetical protein [Nocardioides sp. SYSU DS0663]|uniref:hypothetical protein n=1 Tax=Nocardioides sp. SYSU DS0663 TaxID=3416445 RepID=UPI003F4B905D
MTTTTDTAVTAAVTAHGLMALGLHMAERNLPLYLDIETPAAGSRLDRILVQLDPTSMIAWVDSVETDELREDHRDRLREVHCFGRLPDTGVRVDLYYLAFDHTRAVSA